MVRGAPGRSVTLKNAGGTPVEKLRVSLFIPGFMDFPRESAPLARLAEGQSAAVDLSPLFNASVLGLQEDMTVAVQVTVTFVAVGRAERVAGGVHDHLPQHGPDVG